jgi:hypothetical protein
MLIDNNNNRKIIRWAQIRLSKRKPLQSCRKFRTGRYTTSTFTMITTLIPTNFKKKYLSSHRLSHQQVGYLPQCCLLDMRSIFKKGIIIHFKLMSRVKTLIEWIARLTQPLILSSSG